MKQRNRKTTRLVTDTSERGQRSLRRKSRSTAATARSSFLTPLSSRLRARTSRQTPRRGILLLVVLTMLTLFLLIGTTYLVSANFFRKTGKLTAAATQAQYVSVDQETLLDQALRQLIP